MELDSQPDAKTKTQIQQEKRKDRQRQKEANHRKNKIQVLEKSIQELESVLDELETKMADPNLYKDGHKIEDIQIQYSHNRELLDKLYNDWLSLMDGV